MGRISVPDGVDVTSRRASSLGRRHLVVVSAAFVVGLAALFAVAEVAGAAPDRTPTVVGGSAVPDEKYPFMVSLQFDGQGGSRSEEHFCGATLISPQYVLTAAHCMDGVIDRDNFKKLRIVVGVADLDDAGRTREVRNFSDISVHPRFAVRRGALTYDAAVIRLNEPVEGVAPITLAGPDDNDLESKGRQAVVAGWGSTVAVSPGDPRPQTRFPDRMQEARVPVGGDAFYERSYGKAYLSPIMVGAGKKDEGACFGDSGGPLFASKDGEFRQIGITSFGVGCATARFRAVFAEVNSPKIRPFIKRAAGL